MVTTEHEVLQFLFESSKKNSNNYYDVKGIAGNDALMIANKLAKAGLIKDDIQGDGTKVHCSISIDGIRAVDPAYIETKTSNFLLSVNRAEEILNVIDVLNEKQEGYQFGFDLAMDMQNRDLVKLLYALYPTKVMVEITLEGVRSKN